MIEQDFTYSNTPFYTFDQLFDRSTFTEDVKNGQRYLIVGPEEFQMLDLGPEMIYNRHIITGSIHQSGLSKFTHFYVKPSDLLVRMVCQRMLALRYDTIYFDAIVHQDEVWLYAKNNQIINSGGPIAKIKREDWITI